MEDIEEYEKIRDPIETGFESKSNKQLVNDAKKYFYSFISISKDFEDQSEKEHQNKIETIKLEMTRRLIKSIERFNRQSSEQTKWIIKLTIVMLIVGIANIGLLVYSLSH